MRGMLTVALFLAGPAAANECPGTPVTPAAFVLLGDAAREHLDRREGVAFLAVVGEAEAAVPCLDGTLTPPMAAGFHLVRGIRAYVEEDPEAARRSFASARAADSAVELPAAYAAPGHEVRRLFETAVSGHTATEPLPPPLGRSYLADGREVSARPTDRPALFQMVDADGGILGTWLLDPGDPLPEPVARLVTKLERPPAARRWLLGGGIAATVATGALLGAAGWTRSEFDSTERVPENEAQIDSLYRANHGLVVAAGATGGLAMASGLAAVLVRW